MAEKPFAWRRIDRHFYVGAAVLAALIVFIGFARTYYLKPLFGGPEMTGLAHLHGIVMTLWVVLFVVQATLVSKDRTDLHQRLGIFGGALAAVAVVVGVLTAIASAARGGGPPPPAPPPLGFLVIPLMDMVVFALLIGSALALRGRSDWHKRLMIVGALSILPAAVARIPLEFFRSGGPPVFFGIPDLLILIAVGIDTARNRRLHPAFALGALVVIASHPLRLMLGGTETWMRFAQWLTG